LIPLRTLHALQESVLLLWTSGQPTKNLIRLAVDNNRGAVDLHQIAGPLILIYALNDVAAAEVFPPVA
jgi:hypothetical protein